MSIIQNRAIDPSKIRNLTLNNNTATTAKYSFIQNNNNGDEIALIQISHNGTDWRNLNLQPGACNVFANQNGVFIRRNPNATDSYELLVALENSLV